MNQTKAKGTVYLIGAGPGDPGLLTLKGRDCIRKADIVVYDFLASPRLLAHAREDAEIIYVGKKGGDHTLPQDKINDLIVEKALAGFSVARLKGGDPFIFGRGGEEAEELKEAGVPFEIVPGVTSAIAAPAYAGIPLTHRNHTSSVTLITGHEDPTKKESSLDWENIGKNKGTLVFLMGVKNLPNIVNKLLENGKKTDLPVALVRWGTTNRQEFTQGNLGNIVERVKESGIKSPSIIIVGNVVSLRESLNWFETKPLFRKKIAVTRARSQASDLIQMLSDLGADCIEFPTIKIIPISSNPELEKSIDNLTSYNWIIFTSVNGVCCFFDALLKSGRDARSLGQLKTACIGPSTSDKLKDYGINSDIVPESYRGESVVKAFQNMDMNGKHVLLPRASEARPVIPVELTKMNAIVDEIAVYDTVSGSPENTSVLSNLKNHDLDIVTFTSSSTVRNFKNMIPDGDFESVINGITVASIGPITTATAEELGFKVAIEAEEYTIKGLANAILKHYQN